MAVPIAKLVVELPAHCNHMDNENDENHTGICPNQGLAQTMCSENSERGEKCSYRDRRADRTPQDKKFRGVPTAPRYKHMRHHVFVDTGPCKLGPFFWKNGKTCLRLFGDFGAQGCGDSCIWRFPS